MDKLDAIVPGYVGRGQTFKVEKSRVRGSRRVWQKASQIRTYYALEGVDQTFMAKALYALPETLVTKCAVAANELGARPAGYFIACIKRELAARGK